jgi:iron complex transport system substrate-binding protein
MRLRHSTVVAWIVVAGFLAVGATPTASVEDPFGYEAILEIPVERIATPYAMATYYLYALGAGDRLVASWYIGVRTLADAPPALWSLEPRLEAKQRGGEPNIEELASLEPDWMIVDAVRHASFADLAAELGIPVTRLAVETPEEMLDALQLLAAPLGEDAIGRSDALAAWQRSTLAELRAMTAGFPPDAEPRVLFIGTDPLLVATGDMYQSWMIEAAGGIPVAQDLPGYWAPIDREQLYAWDPDVIIIPAYGPVTAEALLADPDWQPLAAVRNARVYRMERLFAPWDTPVPDSILGVLWLAQRLYPNRLSIDLRAEIARFYERAYGYRPSSEELDRLVGR